MSREAFAHQSLGSIHDLVKKSRVLMVGAGGIGCELLKNLVLMNFGEIHVVDLDTIDLSNLNRQFLFRYEHIKQPKAVVAKQSALRFNPTVKIEAYHANIKDAQFTRTWFKQFGIIFNALDNMDARRYVNRRCIALDIPLVESGTTGFLGQTFVVKKGVTQCYDCAEKETPKTYPVCTIRSEPSQPIHCIVWAKSYLFPETFGSGADETNELNFSAEENDKAEMDTIQKEFAALLKIRSSIGSAEFPKLVFEKVFTDDIQQIALLEDRWHPKVKPAPRPLSFAELERKELNGYLTASRDQSIWTLPESFAVFVDSTNRLVDRITKSRSKDKSATIEFDKDDQDTLDFVAAAANIRSYIFRVDPQSKFDIKKMAGNIIPAIATTNAIIAGACVLQAFKVLSNRYNEAKRCDMAPAPARTERLMTSWLERPNAECHVCATTTYTEVTVDHTATIGDLVKTLQKDLGYSNDLTILAGGQLIYDAEDEDSELSLPTLLKPFAGLESSLAIESDSKQRLVLMLEEKASSDVPVVIAPVSVPDKVAEQDANSTVPSVANGALSNGSLSNGALKVASATDGAQRKRAASEELSEHPATKTKVVHETETEASGPILID